MYHLFLTSILLFSFQNGCVGGSEQENTQKRSICSFNRTLTGAIPASASNMPSIVVLKAPEIALAAIL